MLREYSAQLRIEVYWHRGESLVIVRGDLDGVSTVDLCERLLDIDKALRVLNGQPRLLVVDLAEVGFANQAAARSLAATRQQLAPECHLQLRSPSRAARKVLAPSGLLDDGPLPNGQTSGAPGRDQAPKAMGRLRSRRRGRTSRRGRGQNSPVQRQSAGFAYGAGLLRRLSGG